MAEVEIAVGKSKYKIQCQESEKEKLLETAEKLNERVNHLSFSFRNLDEKTLLVISALTMEEELQNSVGKNTVNEKPAPTEEIRGLPTRNTMPKISSSNSKCEGARGSGTFGRTEVYHFWALFF